MAPRVPPSKLEMIHHMNLSKPLTTSQMAEAAVSVPSSASATTFAASEVSEHRQLVSADDEA
jgi:hypothetical protein